MLARQQPEEPACRPHLAAIGKDIELRAFQPRRPWLRTGPCKFGRQSIPLVAHHIAAGKSPADRIAAKGELFGSGQPVAGELPGARQPHRSEEHTSELQSLMRISY